VKSRALLLYKRGKTYQEIAKKIGVSIATIIKWVEPFKDDPVVKQLRSEAKKNKPKTSKKGRKKRGRKKSNKPPVGTDEVRQILLKSPGIKMSQVATQLGKPYSYVIYRKKFIKVPKVVTKKPSRGRSNGKGTYPTHMKEILDLIPKGYTLAKKADADISMEIHLKRK